jgi:DNA-directed RNA polymerase specialized sigma24 family protein
MNPKKKKPSPPLIFRAAKSEEVQRLLLGEDCLLQHLIVFGMVDSTLNIKAMVHQILNTPLRDLIKKLDGHYLNSQTHLIESETDRAQSSFNRLLNFMDKKVFDILKGKVKGNPGVDLSHGLIGDMVLGTVCPNDEKLNQQWRDALEEARLIARSQREDSNAFDGKVYARYQKMLLGFFRAFDPDARKDVVQDAWVEVWRKISIYDPARGEFPMFVRYWAGIALLRHCSKTAGRNKVLSLLEDLRRWFPEIDEEEEIADLLSSGPLPTEPSFNDPEEVAELYEKMLKKLLDGTSPPHEVIAFGLCKLLFWKPREIVEELSDKRIRFLMQKFEGDYIEKGDLPRERIQSLFQKYYSVMDKTFGEVAKEPRTLKTYPNLINRVVGETSLREYYTKEDPTANISNWWYNVRRRFLDWFGDEPENSGGEETDDDKTDIG